LDLLEFGDDSDGILNAAAWSSLMSSPAEGEGWYKPHYVFTRFIADCAISAGFDAIKYPSVRYGQKCNIVLLNGVEAWKNINIIRIKVRATECEAKIRQKIHKKIFEN